MTIIMKSVANKKIPGVLPPLPKTELDGKICNLSAKTVPELQELLERQLKLLKNDAFLRKLPDKGKKIERMKHEIENELKIKKEADDACLMMNKLSISAISKNAVDNIEWTGKSTNSKEVLDSDDDSEPEDLLHILSQQTSKERKTIIEELPKPLITQADILNIGDIPHVKYIVDKTEHSDKTVLSRQFKPYKTTKSDVHDITKEKARKLPKKWEVTSATPPPILHGPAQVLSIEESLRLQQEYNIHLKEVAAKHAVERLLERTGYTIGEIPSRSTNFTSYRDLDEASVDSDPEGSDKEVYDESLVPEKGGVIVTVLDNL